MSILFFDLETTGLPRRNGRTYSDPSETENYDTSRIVEISYIIYNSRIIKTFSSIIKVEKIDCSYIHGITEEMNIKYGKNLRNILDILEEDLEEYNVEKIVAHNLEFDFNVLLSECFRLNYLRLIGRLNSMVKFCTMLKSREILKMEEYPRLVELCNYFEINNYYPHSAIGDVLPLVKIYNLLTKEKIT